MTGGASRFGVLGPLVLELDGAAVPGGYELDVGDFASLLEQARADPARAGALLRDALGLFRGDPLCDVVCEGSVSEWRRELEEKRVQTTCGGSTSISPTAMPESWWQSSSGSSPDIRLRNGRGAS